MSAYRKKTEGILFKEKLDSDETLKNLRSQFGSYPKTRPKSFRRYENSCSRFFNSTASANKRLLWAQKQHNKCKINNARRFLNPPQRKRSYKPKKSKSLKSKKSKRVAKSVAATLVSLPQKQKENIKEVVKDLSKTTPADTAAVAKLIKATKPKGKKSKSAAPLPGRMMTRSQSKK